jgi:hypothetical protein
VESWRVLTFQHGRRAPVCEATVTMLAGYKRIMSTAEGADPAEALDRAVRGGLERFFPELTAAFVERHSVRLVPSAADGRPLTRILLEAGDGESSWGHGRRGPQSGGRDLGGGVPVDRVCPAASACYAATCDSGAMTRRMTSATRSRWSAR